MLTVARIHGSSFGMPAPGLMPTRDEVQQRLGWVRDAIDAIERAGASADGQVAQTRRPARTIARVARARRVRTVVMEPVEGSRWRSAVEGDTAAAVARSLRRHGIDLELVPPSRKARSAPTTSEKRARSATTPRP